MTGEDAIRENNPAMKVLSFIALGFSIFGFLNAVGAVTLFLLEKSSNFQSMYGWGVVLDVAVLLFCTAVALLSGGIGVLFELIMVIVVAASKRHSLLKVNLIGLLLGIAAVAGVIVGFTIK